MISTAIKPHLWFDDLSSAVDSYHDVLGFDPVTWYPDEETATWCQMKRDDQPLMLAVTPPPTQATGWTVFEPEGQG